MGVLEVYCGYVASLLLGITNSHRHKPNSYGVGSRNDLVSRCTGILTIPDCDFHRYNS